MHPYTIFGRDPVYRDASCLLSPPFLFVHFLILPSLLSLSCFFITPRVCARGKVIGRVIVVVVIVVIHKKSPDLGI